MAVRVRRAARAPDIAPTRSRPAPVDRPATRGCGATAIASRWPRNRGRGCRSARGLTPLIAVDAQLPGCRCQARLPAADAVVQGPGRRRADCVGARARCQLGVADSSGNAGSAIAAYAARAGLGCTVFVPERPRRQASADTRLRRAARDRRPGPHGHGRGGDRRRRGHRRDVRLAHPRPVLPGGHQDDAFEIWEQPVTRPRR